jgi:hypothetical protein
VRRVRGASQRQDIQTALAAVATALAVAGLVACSDKNLTGTESRSSAEAAPWAYQVASGLAREHR